MSINEEYLKEYLKEQKEQIKALLEKYKENTYMTQRLHFHLSGLPNLLETEHKGYEKRVERMNQLSNEQKIFMQVFLSKNRYYYLPNNNCYYFYDGKHYVSVKEDDIQCKLLTEINKDEMLSQWKYKTNIHVLKQIKNRHLFKSIPDSETIQHVIKALCPALFKTKQEVKYFLTVIGDNLLKKQQELIFLTKQNLKHVSAKHVFIEFENMTYINTGFTNVTFNCVTKYHETYNYNNCRLLNMNDSMTSESLKDILIKHGLDILCVAGHYSMRHVDSDTFLEKNADDEFKQYTLYLKKYDQKTIVDKFCEFSLVELLDSSLENPENPENPTEKKELLSNHSKMSWKNMHFIWKHYLSQLSFPGMIYSQQLKTLLKERYVYDEKTDSFLNVTSKYLPVIADFILFWERTMMTTLDEFIDFDYELENDEVCYLFKSWVQENKEETSSNGMINENDIIKILSHFYPDVQIVDKKYIMNISCSLWDKVNDMTKMLTEFKNKYDAEEDVSLIDFDKIYEFYCRLGKSKWKVSKRFFEKYVCYSLSTYIEYDHFLSSSWLTC
jgi:hypothetical protein